MSYIIQCVYSHIIELTRYFSQSTQLQHSTLFDVVQIII